MQDHDPTVSRKAAEQQMSGPEEETFECASAAPKIKAEQTMTETTALIRIKTEVIDKRRITLDDKPYPCALIDFDNGAIKLNCSDFSDLYLHGLDELKALREVVDAAISVSEQRQADIDAQPAPVIEQNGDAVESD